MTAPCANYVPPAEVRTTRLRLREPEPEDVQDLFDVYASDPRATRYLFLETQTDVDAFGQIVEQLRTMRGAGRGAAWVLELTESSRPVGMASVVNGAHGLELAYALGYNYWNQAWPVKRSTRSWRTRSNSRTCSAFGPTTRSTTRHRAASSRRLA